MKTVKIAATNQQYTIGKIVCLARNYAEHAKELGNETPAAPVLFMKPASSVIGDGDTLRIPTYSHDCHHEIELAVLIPAFSQECHSELELALLIGRDCQSVSAEKAMEYVAGYGLAIDMTLRDVQGQLKAKGLPWEIAKGFDTACPLSDFVPAATVADPHALKLKLAVNGEPRQNGSSADMIQRIPQIVAYISGIFTLEPGDVILTGTPAGVGPVKAGDVMTAEISTVGRLTIPVT
jgi:acylpyruvate hydrolase